MIGIFDSEGWQTTVNLMTGKIIEPNDYTHPIGSRIAAQNPYPGDQSIESINWVTNTALDLVRSLHPHIMVLVYATPFFIRTFTSPDESRWKESIQKVYSEIDRFFKETDYTPVIIGSGSLTKVKKKLDILNLEGLAVPFSFTNWASIRNPTESDMAWLSSHPDISRIISKNEIISTLKINPKNISKLPDYLLLGDRDNQFSGFMGMTRHIYYISSGIQTIPAIKSPGPIQKITDLRKKLIEWGKDNPIALILIEGIGMDEISNPAYTIDNSEEWYTYGMGTEQYLAMMCGLPIGEQPFPPGTLHFLEDGESKPYPFSGMFKEIPQTNLAEGFKKTVGAVSNRSVIAGMTIGADITIECRACNQYNYGNCAIIRERNIEI